MSGFLHPTYQQRVVSEKAYLDDNLVRLKSFITGGGMVNGDAAFNNLDHHEQVRLRAQLIAMQAYSSILGERIAAFPATK